MAKDHQVGETVAHTETPHPKDKAIQDRVAKDNYMAEVDQAQKMIAITTVDLVLQAQ